MVILGRLQACRTLPGVSRFSIVREISQLALASKKAEAPERISFGRFDNGVMLVHNLHAMPLRVSQHRYYSIQQIVLSTLDVRMTIPSVGQFLYTGLHFMQCRCDKRKRGR